jgi:outer membrane protein OmpA-like peptidoglycan-associated protein
MSEREKEKALKIAKSVEGCYGVEDNITIEKAKIIAKKTVFEPVEDNLTAKETVTKSLVKNDENDIDLLKEESILPNIASTEIKSCQKRLDKLLSESKINFISAKADIKKESFPLLEKMANIIKECRGSIKTITIEGHTDSSGIEKSNLLLSQDRAEAVKNYLVNKFDIDEHMLKAVGFGENKHIADNNTEEGKSENRRIEFKLEGGVI